MFADQIFLLWTRPMLERFKVAHRAAVNTQAETFIFDGHEFVVGYAKYLIEYLNLMFREGNSDANPQPQTQSAPR